MKTLAIITARGGSKRIPRKNIKEFCGKPILAYSIEAALSCGAFDTVMVSTDDAEIAEIARQYGAEVPFMRSEQTANDFATTPDVVREVLAEYEKRGEHFEIASFIFPTAPFLTGERLREAVENLKASDADTLMPVVSFSFPPQRGLVVREGHLVFAYPQYMDARSQDLEPHYHDAGQFGVFRTEAFARNGKFWLGKVLPMVLSEMEVQDIDTQTDWEIAEMKYRLMQK
jgi:N-acylneuraminate cytidylyltransferase